MRLKRLKAPANSASPVAFYHCVSRVVNRDFVLGDAEKAQFLAFMRLYERFCGVRVVAYCLMSNHFHLLVGVPKRPAPEAMPSNAELIRLVRSTLGDLEATALEWALGEAAKIQSASWEAEIRERYLRRMWDISFFMKSLKQRFTQWFNKVHQRRGTLWEGRFKSVLVESAGEPLRAMAAYIDLNPVRANLVEAPKDYAWSSYGAAMSGDLGALEGLAEVEEVRHAGEDEAAEAARQAARTGQSPERRTLEVLCAHRALLYGRGEERGMGEDGLPMKKGFTREESRRVVECGGRLPAEAYLRCRVRYFTDGEVVGSRGYVNGVFEAERGRYGARRRTGARLMAGLSREEKLYSLRDLKVDKVG
jgi:REP element-mobilizing transposase RayT